MSLYIVSDQGKDQWLAYEDAEAGRVYAYLPHLGRFVYHHPLTTDFYWDREVDWRPVEPAAAQELVAVGELGTLDRRRHGVFLAKLEAERDTRSLEQVFGAQAVEDRTPTAREAAEAKVLVMFRAKPGQWVTYRTYPAARPERARAAASAIRTGKLAAVKKAKKKGLRLDARVTSTADGRLAVQMSRLP